MHVFSKAAYECIIAYKKIAAANKDFVIKTLQGSDRDSVSGYCAFGVRIAFPVILKSNKLLTDLMRNSEQERSLVETRFKF